MFGEEKLHNVSRKRSNGPSPAGTWLLLPKISLILAHVLISSLPSGVGWPLKTAPESRFNLPDLIFIFLVIFF